MNDLIKILKISANKHGAKTPLTIGHLLNICIRAQRQKEGRAGRELQEHMEILEEINPLGQD